MTKNQGATVTPTNTTGKKPDIPGGSFFQGNMICIFLLPYLVRWIGNLLGLDISCII